MLGNDVLMVSGSDSHGTPITVRAEQEGIDPEDILNRFHPEFLDSWKQLGISFDLFTTTHTKNHEEVVQQIFTDLLAKDYIYKADMLLAYCSKCDRFLPDRYVEGRCPNCSNLQARGDQCELCVA
jgi:methionyl-tRNA synthetase